MTALDGDLAQLTGSFHAGWLVTKAGREVVALSDGKAKRSVGGVVRGLAGNPVDYSLLAGLGTALGFLVPQAACACLIPGPGRGQSYILFAPCM